ncbi:MAG TPA: peptidylprolyl isomerase, partial [Candidatus Limnocylindria bacterium]
MTSQTRPSRPSIRSRLTGSSSSGSSRRGHDPEARFTRNVTIAFAAIIVATLVIVLIAFIYAFWEANVKPLATVNGTQIGRGAWEDRQRLELFRADRADDATRAALAAGQIDEELANRRLTASTEVRNQSSAVAMENLVQLTHQSQLAEERGITLPEDELAAALAADGSFPEMRRISALVIQPDGAATGQATAQDYADARARAQEARAALVAGTPLADLVDDYSPATAANAGDLGYASREDLRSNVNIDPVWAEQLWGQDQGVVGDIVESENGDQLLGVITAIVPEMLDDEFLNAVNEELGTDVHERNVRLEATARKLEEAVIAEATDGDVDQVRLAEILIAGDTAADPSLDEGSIRASHILYTPETAEADASATPDGSPAPAASPALSESPAASPAASEGPAASTSSAPVASALPSLSADLLVASISDMAAPSRPEAAALASASPESVPTAAPSPSPAALTP